jgi:hypothetical protein
MNIDEEVKIDRTKLDVECEQSAETLYYYSKELAVARTNLDSANTNMKNVTAKKQLYYRTTPPEGLKVTEAVIDAAVTNDKEVQDAVATVDAEQAKVNLLYAAVNSLNEKSLRLKDLVSLHNNAYFNSGNPADGMHERCR